MSTQDQFFNLHLTETQKTSLLRDVNQICACLPSDHDRVRASLLQTVEDSLYKQSIASCAAKNLLTEAHPVLRTTADKHACSSVSSDKINNRRSVLRSVWRHTGHSGEPDRQQANTMLQNVNENVAALQKVYKTAGSWSTMTIAWLQMVRVHGFSELGDEYYNKISAIEPPAAKTRDTISSEDAETIRAENVKLAEEALQHNDVQQAQNAILALLCWGTTKEHCPQRRSDFRLLQWGDVSVDDGNAKLNFNCSAKTAAKASICIAETNPMLSQLLAKLKPQAQDASYLISDNLLARTTINKRLLTSYKKTGLEDRLCKLASSTNNARHRSVADGPKRLSSEESEQSQKRAKARLHSVNAANTMYAQDTIGTV